MSKEVKRYGVCGFESGIVEMEDGPYVDSDDYDALRSLSDDQAAAVTALNKHTEALAAERDALLAERDARAKDAERESAAFNAVITYILGKGSMESPMEFLRCWNEGDFESLREEWPEAPQEIYYADPFADYDAIDAALQGAQP